MVTNHPSLANKALNITVVVTSFGYFIDMFDFLLFNMVRVKSLTALGLTGDALTQGGLLIVNCQMVGILLGAYLSGVLGDKYGRKASLFGSIIVYSLGTIGCAFVTTIPIYALARFVTGLGLSGELGAGIALIAEKLHASRRGFGVMIFIAMGFVGVLAAALAAEFLPWRVSYLVGGAGGSVLLLTRMLLSESGLFMRVREQRIAKGGLRLIVRTPGLLKKYISIILLMACAVFGPQIMWTLSPELGKAMGITDAIKPNIVLAVGYSGFILGDLMAAYLSERWKSRKKASLLFLGLGTLCLAKYIFWPAHSLIEFYLWNGLFGFVVGVWVVGAMWAAEHFGTNIRSTAAATIPNFARGLAIPMNIAYAHLKILGPLGAAGIIGFVIFAFAFIGWRNLSETHGRNLDYLTLI